MSRDKDDRDVVNPNRRRVLGTLAAAGALGVAGHVSAEPAPPEARQPAPPVTDAALAANIETVVVIYAENRSFNNLFPEFPGLQAPLSKVPAERFRQYDRDGTLLETLPPIWGGMVPHEQVVEHESYQIREGDITGLANAPFALRTPAGDPLPHGLITRDLIHAFYNNQLQINGGKNDRFVAWGDSGALVMGHYGNVAANLRIWNLAREFTLCDNFFMGTFGGSFINHQYLVAARPPFFPHADQSASKDYIAEVEGDDPTGIQLKQRPDSPASAMQGPPKMVPNALSPDFWAVNTMLPPYMPSIAPDPARPGFAKPDTPLVIPPQHYDTIGDKLAKRGIDWAWYAGGWDAALDGHAQSASFPSRPNFQMHHQPFNYFAQFAPGTAERPRRLRDAGMGETARTNKFLADAEAGTLPPVAFYKPQGNLNMHAGYSDVDAGDRHIAMVVEALRNSPQWGKMLIVITFDENGGWWDHVAPPKGDRWGPSTRIPALIVSPHARRGAVDHTIYDTGSIARFITRRFGLEKLPGLIEREQAMKAAGGPAPGDLTGALAL